MASISGVYVYIYIYMYIHVDTYNPLHYITWHYIAVHTHTYIYIYIYHISISMLVSCRGTTHRKKTHEIRPSKLGGRDGGWWMLKLRSAPKTMERLWWALLWSRKSAWLAGKSPIKMDDYPIKMGVFPLRNQCGSVLSSLDLCFALPRHGASFMGHSILGSSQCGKANDKWDNHKTILGWL